jgi:hypothetical protein
MDLTERLIGIFVGILILAYGIVMIRTGRFGFLIKSGSFGYPDSKEITALNHQKGWLCVFAGSLIISFFIF